MKTVIAKFIFAGVALILFASASFAAQRPTNRRALAAQVRAEFLHAWNGYKKYCGGHDELKPISKTCRDWYDTSLLMTPVDSLDTMILMGLNDEAKTTREYIATHLSFDKDIYVQNFEITIRLLGGLLTGYEMTGDKRLLTLADDLGRRLLPVFESPTGLPYRYVNLKTGKVRGEVTNPAESGTLLIEFGTLSKHTGKRVYFDKAKRALVETYNRRSRIGLVGTWINVETGQWTNTDSHISGAIDSYYEYLLKCAILFNDKDCRRMWNESIVAINRYLSEEKWTQSDRKLFPPRVRGGVGGGVGPRRPSPPNPLSARGEGGGQTHKELWCGHADMNTGKRTATTYGALDAFFPAVLALSGDLYRARRLQLSSFAMWNEHDIEPEEFDYSKGEVVSAGYPLRPEIVESTYFLYHFTRDPAYLRMGEKMWKDFVRHCRTDDAYAALKSVVTKEKNDSMQSFLFAETFKYFYLLFEPRTKLNFDKVIFNTEAHPVRRK
ncbi:MAG TPA: glycoside hydrolase family 47 protein [Pyrinomonadaceae bacterium]|nr:glycoside hydrolase family 47 protein [Pyrinomonadaceae bacterium]